MEEWMRVCTLVLVLLAGFGLGCNDREDVFGPLPVEVTIRMRADEVDPDDAELAAGGTVTWRFEGATEHNLIFELNDNAPLDEETMHSGGEEVERVFPRTGIFRFFCREHPDLKGIIRVR
jgi:plastocyanin